VNKAKHLKEGEWRSDGGEEMEIPVGAIDEIRLWWWLVTWEVARARHRLSAPIAAWVKRK
jgi:hypothetical protein